VRTEIFKCTLLSILIITSLAAFLLVITAAKPLEASPGAIYENLPTDDTFVVEGYPNTVVDSGTGYCLYVGWDEQVYLSERTYLKFDLNIIPDYAIIDNAYLWLYNRYPPSIGEYPYTSKDITVEACRVENDAWLENELTWNIAEANHPPVGSAIDTQTILSTDTDHWEYWDVTSYVQSEVAGDKIVTICLKSTAENIDDSVVNFCCSKDYYPDQPRVHLEAIWRAPPAPPVGGIVRPVDKLALLAPWIILAALIAIVAVSVAVYLRRRQQKARVHEGRRERPDFSY